MTTVTRPGMPPMPSKPTGPQTCDRWGNVISTSETKAPSTPKPVDSFESAPKAPTCDRWGHIIEPTQPEQQQPASNMPPAPEKPTGPQTCDRYGNVIYTAPSWPEPQQPPASDNPAPTCDRWGNIISK